MSKLLSSGLLKGSFMPTKQTRELRDLTHRHRKITRQMALENRLQRILQDVNIKLSNVISNMNGATATRITNAMIEGQASINELVKLQHGKLEVSKEDLAKSIKAHLIDYHIFMLITTKSGE